MCLLLKLLMLCSLSLFWLRSRLFCRPSVMSAVFMSGRSWWYVCLLAALVPSAGAGVVINRNKSVLVPCVPEQWQNSQNITLMWCQISGDLKKKVIFFKSYSYWILFCKLSSNIVNLCKRKIQAMHTHSHVSFFFFSFFTEYTLPPNFKKQKNTHI